MLINLTPHAVRVIPADGSAETVIPPSGQVARVAVRLIPAGMAAGIALVRGVYGAVTGLPTSVEGTMYIVSSLVRSASPGRTDLASPADLVRDSSGAVVGCRGLEVL